MTAFLRVTDTQLIQIAPGDLGYDGEGLILLQQRHS